MVMQSTEEAMALLKKWRGYLIACGRATAIGLCLRDGDTDSREVTDEMERQGLLEGYKGKYCWIGSVFNKSGLFEFTGEYRTHSNPRRNNHEQVLRVWKLKPSAPCHEYEFPAEVPSAMSEPVEQVSEVVQLREHVADLESRLGRARTIWQADQQIIQELREWIARATRR